MIDPRRFFEIYTAISLNQKGRFDCFKYKFKTRIKEETYVSHKCKYHFDKFSRVMKDEQDAIDFIFSNVLYGKTWISNFDNENYVRLKGYREDLEERFISDYKKFFNGGFKNFESQFDEWLNSNEIEDIHFYGILDYITDGAISKKLAKKYSDDILFENFQKKMLTFSKFIVSFMQLDSNKKKNLLNKLSTIIKGN